MRERLITAAILVPLILAALLYLSGEIVAGLLALVLAYCAWEWSGFVARDNVAARIVFVLVVVALQGALIVLAGFRLRIPGMLELASFAWMLSVIAVARFPIPLPPAIAALIGVPVLVVAWAALALLALAGWQWLLFMLVLIWAADVGAYFAGKRFGVRKLAPRVSPGKTWAGVAGGLALSLAVAVAGAIWSGLPVPAFLLLCMVAVMVSILGDLTVSMFKRARGLKDTGNLLPGHGGMLDRVDSLLAASPVFVLGLVHLGIIQ